MRSTSEERNAARTPRVVLRSVEAVEQDVARGHLLPEFAEWVHAVSDRDGARTRRLDRARPTRTWWTDERERVLSQGMIEPLRPGEVTREQFAERLVASSQVAKVDPPTSIDGGIDMEELAAMLDEKLDRRRVREVQSGREDQDRFEKWIAVLQERVRYSDPIVLLFGEGLNIVRRRTDQFYCPSCARQLEVEVAPPGYPLVHEVLPDITGFYRGWRGREVPR
jgi:acetone carboxylase gamma subunit